MLVSYEWNIQSDLHQLILSCLLSFHWMMIWILSNNDDNNENVNNNRIYE